jgi:Zn-dependent membrane protease YugP
MFYYDPYYWCILLPAFIISIVAQMRVSSAFRRFSQMRTSRHFTGAQAAEAVLRAAGILDVRIERVSGHLSDHYDPRSNVIRLSNQVYDMDSVSAVGVAAHEAGHAVQYATGYTPVRLRSALIPVCNIGSQLSFVLLLVGLILYSEPLFGLGVILFGVAVLGQVVTLPVEFNASRRAIAALADTHILDDQELNGARKVLSAAAMTYVAALLVSLAQLLRYLLAFSGRRRD